MSRDFLPYVAEFRTRIIRCLVLFFFLFFCLFPFRRFLYHCLARPMLPFLSTGHFISTAVMSPFWVPVKLVFFLSFLIGLPFFLSQLWLFLSPALYHREKKVIVAVVFLGFFLFLLGLLFSYFIVFPVVFMFSHQALPRDVLLMTDIECYWSFVFSCFLSFGFCFELPVIMLLMSFSPWFDAPRYVAYRRYAIVLSFVVAAVLAPPDVLSQCLLAIPLCFLYELGIVLSRLRWFRRPLQE